MVNASMYKDTRVLPDPVTAFRNTAEKDIRNMAPETTRMTGIACFLNSSDCPNIEI